MTPVPHDALPPEKALAARTLAVLDGWQRGFPLLPRPFAAIARAVGMDEQELLAELATLARDGVLGRVGATIRPNTVGASMLAAMQVPPDRLDEVARIVNAEPGVNHNYEREHAINLWFVIAAPSRSELAAALGRISRAAGLEIIELPLERAYFIDLGFALGPAAQTDAVRPERSAMSPAQIAGDVVIDDDDRCLLQALERGLMLVPRPYLALAQETGSTEAATIARIARMIASGVIARFGLIVRHRRLGYRANAMVVFDIADARVDEIGARFAEQDFVTLCYRRPRRGDRWPYNLFCMIHGQSRDRVLAQVATLRDIGAVGTRHAVLFSRRCYLQRGTRMGSPSLPVQEAAQ